MFDRGFVLAPAFLLLSVSALFYFNPAGIRDAVIENVMGILSTHASSVGALVIVGFGIALMLYCLVRIIKP